LPRTPLADAALPARRLETLGVAGGGVDEALHGRRGLGAGQVEAQGRALRESGQEHLRIRRKFFSISAPDSV